MSTAVDVPPWVKVHPGQTPCVSNPELFRRVSDEEDRRSKLSSPAREAQRATLMRQLVDAAEACCWACPLRSECLHDAVTGLPVAGFVAGTTSKDRRRLRATLEVPRPVDVDLTHAATGRHQQGHRISVDDTIATMEAHPTWTVTQVAQHLGCAAVTVRRHLRRRRAGQGAPAPRPSLTPGDVDATWQHLRAS